MSRGRSSFGRGAAVVTGVMLGLAVLASDGRVRPVHLVVLALAVWAGYRWFPFRLASRDMLPHMQRVRRPFERPSSRPVSCVTNRVAVFHPEITGLRGSQAST